MFSFSFSFSKPRIISIVLLLAILVISLFFSSYSEGMDPTATVNKDAPKVNDDNKPSDNKPLDNTGATLTDGIALGSSKPLTVSDITGVLQNNPGVQKMINNMH